MNESDLKRYLIKSIRQQGGLGQRFEDKFTVGFPDLVLIPKGGPVFFIEAKIIKGAKLVCTEIQGVHLERLNRPDWHCYGLIVGFKEDTLYIGKKDAAINTCVYVERPRRLDSPDWPITDLLTHYRDLKIDIMV